MFETLPDMHIPLTTDSSAGAHANATSACALQSLLADMSLLALTAANEASGAARLAGAWSCVSTRITRKSLLKPDLLEGAVVPLQESWIPCGFHTIGL